MSIQSRGMTNAGDLIHMEHPQSGMDLQRGEPLCRNGSWHIIYTKKRKYVTCPYCLELLIMNDQR